MMASIALIGPDGAGKTTITRMLEHSGLLPFKYLYMGINTASSNVALPTSRLIESLKARPGQQPALPEQRSSVSRRAGRNRGHLWRTARLVNRLAEEWFRQLLSWSYQLRGYAVLYDRHFVFDFAGELATGRRETFDKRLHRWFLTHLYPRPSLVIFLDAPGTVLFARKGESTAVELEQRRQALLSLGARLPGFVRVEATRPLSEVYAEVASHIVALYGNGRVRSAPRNE